MADRIIQSETLQSIANAIRTKKESQNQIDVTNFSSEILSIPTGSSDPDYSSLVRSIVGTYVEEVEE